MKILFMTGSHPRHAYLAERLAGTGALAGLVIEEREEFLPSPPQDIPEDTQKLFVRHFQGRSEAEARFFGGAKLPASTRSVTTTAEDLNGDAVMTFVKSVEPDLILSYGVHKLSDQFLEQMPGRKWNIHGGLSPWYRGVITHFWPSYMLEPQMTGMTLHETTADIDGGEIIHQAAAPLVRGDGVHDLACRAVAALAEEFAALFAAVAKMGGPDRVPRHRSKTTGRIWRASDWRPAHLPPIYDHFNNRVVDHYLDGALQESEPRLFRQQI